MEKEKEIKRERNTVQDLQTNDVRNKTFFFGIVSMQPISFHKGHRTLYQELNSHYMQLSL